MRPPRFHHLKDHESQDNLWGEKGMIIVQGFFLDISLVLTVTDIFRIDLTYKSWDRKREVTIF